VNTDVRALIFRSFWVAALAVSVSGIPVFAQDGGWTHWGGDAGSQRYSELDQIDASNFADLEVAWVWRGDNFGPSVDNILRSTPIYAEGKLITVAGARRTVVAIDPATGETLWTFREPETKRWADSMRKNYGKGVAYSQVNGKGRIYVVTPAFFLHALDPDTGYPIQTFGNNGTIDLLADFGYEYHPTEGLPSEVGYITNSTPPMVVNGVVVVGNSHEQGYRQTRQENVPGHILAYNAETGAHMWKFNVIPQSESEFGFDTWENDAWQWTGNVSAWAPMSADPDLGLVYIVTDPPTNDFWGGFHPGQNLFATTILALNVRTGARVWHFQTVHHDIWNYDNPTAPNLVDITVDGREIPALVQTTKQSFAYVLNRETGEPVWPIEERPVPQGHVPGEYYSPTQPFPTKPAAYEMQNVTEDELIDFTPELRQEALEILNQYQYGPLFTPPLHAENDLGKRAAIHCPGSNGGTNIMGGASIDPETGILYVASTKACSAPMLTSGAEADTNDPNPIGRTVAEYVAGPGGVRGPRGLPLFKPPWGRITAIDLNTGDTLWWIPNGTTPDRVLENEALQGVDIGNTGQPAHPTTLVTKTLLMYGEGRGGRPLFHAVDKATGRELATVEMPASTNTAQMTFMHQGKQYVVLPVGGRGFRGGGFSGSLVALTLPD
jgi:quinoprotein glucose dehydrogenase